MNRRVLTILLLAYWIVLIYASLMPMDFRGLDHAAQRLGPALQTWPLGDRLHFSHMNTVVNVLLYIPLGFALVTWWTIRHRRWHWAAVAAAAMLAAGTSLLVESGQLFTVSRNPNSLDLLMNSLGGILGAVLGVSFGRPAWVRLRRLARKRIARRPMTLVAAGLMAMLAADAVSPYWIHTRIWPILRSLRHSHLSLEQGLSLHPWHHWLVLRAGLYAVLTIVLGAASRHTSRTRWVRGALLATLFAIGIESAKLLVPARLLNVGNIAMSALGAVAGCIVALLLARRISARQTAALATGLVLAYVLYTEWRPWAFVWDWDFARARLPRSWRELLPFYHYALGGRLVDIQLFVRTVVLGGSLAFCLNLARGRRLAWWRAAILLGFLGLITEGGQLFLPGRTAAATDVYAFALGGALGSWVYARHLRWRSPWLARPGRGARAIHPTRAPGPLPAQGAS